MTTPPAEPALSELLRSLPSDGEDLTFADLSRLLGSQVHGFALLLLAIPDAVPLPVPSVSAILGVPLLAISAHLTFRGESGELPQWLGRRLVPAAVVRLLRTRLAGVLALGERLTQPRLHILARRERLIGAVSMLLSLLLLLPLPLFNTPPAICLVLLSWGLFRRDGLFVLAGLIATLAMLVLMAYAAAVSQEYLARLFGWSG